MSDGTVTIAGNIVDEPELRFTQNGTAVCNFRVAVNDSYRNAQGEWKESLNGFFSVNVWRQQAESVAELLGKGDRVVVSGILKNRSFKDRDGNERWVTEIQASDVGKSLKFWHREKERANVSDDREAQEGQDHPF